MCLRIDTIQVHCKLSLEKDTIPLYCELEWIPLCMVMEKYQAFSLLFCDLSVDYINQNSKPWLDITFSYLFLCSGCKKRSVFLLLFMTYRTGIFWISMDLIPVNYDVGQIPYQCIVIWSRLLGVRLGQAHQANLKWDKNDIDTRKYDVKFSL